MIYAVKTIKNFLRHIFRAVGLDIIRYQNDNLFEKVVTLKPRQKNARGNVLISYILESFLLKEGEDLPTTHTHFSESVQIVNTFLELGYAVDVIDYRNKIFVPTKDYVFFVSARTNFQRIAQLLNNNCVKIAHLDMAHWIFNNHAAYTRCLSVQQRKGVALRNYKLQEINWAIEHADYATVLGNEFTISTYRYAKKSIFRIPISTCNEYPWPEGKDFYSQRKCYLWFGSSGLVHKGLDLTLEAFSEMPDYHLYVCGPIKNEKDFEKVYYKELYQTPNIHMIGWVDVSSSLFTDITDKCVGLIYPSCSEGGGGSVINCMHAGLIPIVSYESSVDIDDFGIYLNNCSVEEIKRSVRMVSNQSAEKLKKMSRKAWDFARTNHTRDRFAKEYRKVIEKLQNNSRKQKKGKSH